LGNLLRIIKNNEEGVLHNLFWGVGGAIAVFGASVKNGRENTGGRDYMKTKEAFAGAKNKGGMVDGKLFKR